MKPPKAMVLAAGKGTRLLPLTGEIPKPMAPVAGTPIIQHIFNLLAGHGIKEVYVNVHYLADVLLKAYGEESHINGTTVRLNREEKLAGTAGGVRRLQSNFDDTFIVIMGDALTDIDLQDLVTFHKEKEALATMALKRVSDASEYGVVEVDHARSILSFQEKPDPGEAVSDLANTGIYVLQPEVLEYIPDNTFFDFAKDVFPLLLGSGEKVVGYDEGDFYWSDIGTLESYRAAQRDALLGRVAVEVPGKRWGRGPWVAEKAQIHPSAYGHISEYAVVGEEAVIGQRATLSGVVAVGDGCRVGDEATVKQSVLLPGSSVGSGAYLEDCVVGPGYEVRPEERIRGCTLVR